MAPALFPRALAATVRRAAKTFPAVLVTGARQTGKTTLLRTEFGASHEYVSLERPEVRDRARADPVGFLAERRERVFLDEVQYAPELLHHLKDSIDADRRPGRWVLSGSQTFPLMQGVSQTLAGRVAVLTLDPLSVREVRRAPSPASVDAALSRVFGAGAPGAVSPRVDALDWLLRGGFPELRRSRRVDRDLWVASYVQTYLERDVRALLNVGDLGAFQRFVGLLAARAGGLLNASELARDVGVAVSTIDRWTTVLEASQLVTLLRPYHRNFGKRLVKAPRVVFRDPALASFLVGLHGREPLRDGPMYGPLFENAVVSEWLKLFHGLGAPAPVSYWRSSAGLEVDLVIDYGGRLHGVEVKATSTPGPGHAARLAQWLALAGPGARGVVACNIDRPVVLRPGIRAVPWHLAW